jgi:hypothetical protein
MTPPISPSDLRRVLKTLPPERPDPFPHLGDLNADQLIQRRVEVTSTIKTLEQERQVIAESKYCCPPPGSEGSGPTGNALHPMAPVG